MDEPTLPERPGVCFATCECTSSHGIDSDVGRTVSMESTMDIESMSWNEIHSHVATLHEPSWNPLSLSHRSPHPAQFFDHPTFEIRLATPPARLVPSVSFSEDSWDSSIQSTTALQSEHSTTSSSTDPPESHCDIEGCSAVFSGVHRKGNLSRHKRLKHSDRVYVCEDASCGRVFNRQDARLKHYRKYHLQLASPYLARPQPRQSNRERCPDL